jgi:endonuclease/exonuclease/phosphatase family metal-dependent hydrolase
MSAADHTPHDLGDSGAGRPGGRRRTGAPGRRTWLAAVAATLLVLGLAVPSGAAAEPVRVATFNASLNRSVAGELVEDLSGPDDPQAQRIAEIIQRTRPDVLLLNEFDFVEGGVAVELFQDNYLAVSQGGAEPIRYAHWFVDDVNTGVPSGLDLDNSGDVGGPGDAFGFGFFPGQFGMAVLSRFPIDEDAVRTFQTFLWADMPGALLPPDWYSAAELEAVRLSSKDHWDVPIDVGGAQPLHFLVSHPTPPVFDDPVLDQNGRRNHDEIRFWADYVRPSASGYVYDDDGDVGGLPPGDPFVIAGDQNADPLDGDSRDAAAQQLLTLPGVRDPMPTSAGAVEDNQLDGGVNVDHDGDPSLDTADFSDAPPFGAGNLRVDYVLPSRQLRVVDSGVFWPVRDDPLFDLVGDDQAGTLSSDHRLVWVDLAVPGRSGR